MAESKRTLSATGSQGGEDKIEETLAIVRQALEQLRFGSVGLTVHDGRVVQIDVTEKQRLQ